MKRLAMTVAVLLLGSFSAAAQPEPGSEATVLYSASRMVRLVGFYKPDAMMLGQFADEVQERLTRTVGIALTVPATTPITWRAAAEPDTPARLVPRMGRDDVGWFLRLVLVNPDGLSLDEVLTCHTRSLLLLMGDQQQWLPDTVRWDRLPEWFVVGIYAGLFPESKRKNLAMVLEDWRQGLLPPLETLLSLREIPDGAGSQRAWACAVVEWLRSGTSNRLPLVLEELFRLPLEEQTLWIQARREQVAFEVWLARQDQGVLLRGLSPVQVLEQVEAILSSLTPTDPTLHPGQTILHWLASADPTLVREQALSISMQLREVSVAAEDELAAILDGYSSLLKEIATGERPPSSTRSLRKRLTGIDRKFAAWKEVVLARHTFLDRVEADWEMEFTPPAPGAPEDPARAAALRRLLDDAERQVGGAAGDF